MEGSIRTLRTAEAATYCGSAKSTFEKLRVVGGGPRFFRLGRTVVYDTRDLDDWLEAKPRYSSTSDGDETKSRTLVLDVHTNEIIERLAKSAGMSLPEAARTLILIADSLDS